MPKATDRAKITVELTAEDLLDAARTKLEYCGISSSIAETFIESMVLSADPKPAGTQVCATLVFTVGKKPS